MPGRPRPPRHPTPLLTEPPTGAWKPGGQGPHRLDPNSLRESLQRLRFCSRPAAKAWHLTSDPTVQGARIRNFRLKGTATNAVTCSCSALEELTYSATSPFSHRLHSQLLDLSGNISSKVQLPAGPSRASAPQSPKLLELRKSHRKLPLLLRLSARALPSAGWGEKQRNTSGEICTVALPKTTRSGRNYHVTSSQ